MIALFKTVSLLALKPAISYAEAMAPTITAELLPSPLENGILFSKTTLKFSFLPVSSKKISLKILKNILFLFKFTLPLPSPFIDTELNFAGSIFTLLKSFKLSPKASKPGPKFALVAGTKMFKISPKLLG